MKTWKFWMAVVIVWIAANILNIVSGPVWMAMGKMTDLLDTNTSPVWYLVGNFCSAAVFTWVYDRVYSSFAGGVRGGLVYGFYAGILLNFPTWIVAHLMFRGFPYGLAWIWTGFGIISCVIWGLVLGAVYRKK